MSESVLSDCNWESADLFAVDVVFHLEAVGGEIVEILDLGVKGNDWGIVNGTLDKLLHDGNMAIARPSPLRTYVLKSSTFIIINSSLIRVFFEQ